MPIDIGGREFHTASELAEELGVSRQTMWRWRRQGKVPAGKKYRNGQVVFSGDEAGKVRCFGNRLEPVKMNADKLLG